MSAIPGLLIIVLAISLVTTVLASPVPSRDTSTNLSLYKIQSACAFLESLYNSTIGLVRTTPTNASYYIASDNILASQALRDCNTAYSVSTGSSITLTIARCCSRGDDLMHEALLGMPIPLPIHTSNVFKIANNVFWEVHNSTSVFPDCVYGDVAVYTALGLQRRGNTTGAQYEMDCLSIMFDGKGIADEPYKDGTVSEHGVYQTYKLALYIYAQHKFTGDYGQEELSQLLRMQGPDGGFHTGYDQAGTYAMTQENTETTSIAIIALNSVLPLPCNCQYCLVTVWIGLAIVAIAVVGVVLYMEHQRRRRS